MLQSDDPREYGPLATPIRVLIVDDFPLARAGIRAMVGTSDQIQIAGEAATAEEALALVPACAPTIVLMDYGLPGMDGIEATRALKERYPEIAVIIMANDDDPAVVLATFQAGASGFLVKDASRALLVHSIQAVTHGGSLVTTSLVQQALGAVKGSAKPPVPMRPRASAPLTEREQRILQLLAEGKTNKAIGLALGYAEITVKKHVQEIVAKLDAADRTHAAVTAVRLGLVS